MVPDNNKRKDDEIDLDKWLDESNDLLDEFPYAVAIPDEETPGDVNPEEVGVEISMYLGWAIDAKLVSDKLETNCKSLLKKFRNREVLSRTILRECCADKLEVVHFSEMGNAFTKCYYRPGWSHFYYQDLGELFPEVTDFAYLPDNWENYQAVSALINSRFKEWSIGTEKKGGK
jgi:hypothetical protein